jgi:hypothetical protein
VLEEPVAPVVETLEGLVGKGTLEPVVCGEVERSRFAIAGQIFGERYERPARVGSFHMGNAIVGPPKQPVDCTACQRSGIMPDTEPDDDCKEPHPVPKKTGPVKLGDPSPTREDGLRDFCKRRPHDAGPPVVPSGVPLRGRAGGR